jgi:hypothetical protein
MIDYWLWDLIDCMRHEEEKIPGMNATYTVKHIQKGPTLFINCGNAVDILYKEERRYEK